MPQHNDKFNKTPTWFSFSFLLGRVLLLLFVSQLSVHLVNDLRLQHVQVDVVLLV